MNKPTYLCPELASTEPWMIQDGGALDIDECPDCWERRAHIERYQFACKVLPGGCRVLDFGCGVGYGSEMLFLAGNKVTAVDTSNTALNVCRARRVVDPKLVFTEPGKFDTFDACVAFEVVEHLDNPEEFVQTVNARHLIASVPVVPTVGINPHHKSDFTIESFKTLLETRFDIRSWWVQILPFHSAPCVMIAHGEAR